VAALKKAVRDDTAAASNGSGRAGKTAPYAATALEDPN
jgi:hypothetical protein